MIKDVYLFVDGSLAVFDEGGQAILEFSVGKLNEEKKEKLKKDFYDGTRITLARWKKGFFELTREEFLAATVVQNILTGDGSRLQLMFHIEDGKPNEADRTN